LPQDNINNKKKNQNLSALTKQENPPSNSKNNSEFDISLDKDISESNNQNAAGEK